MAELRPRVRIDVKQAVTLTAQAGQKVVAIIGTAQWGVMNTVVTLNSFSQALESFKDDIAGDSLTLVKGLDLLYQNGADTVLAVRIGDGNELKASKAFDGNSGGELGVLTFSGSFEGTHGNNIGITITANANNPSNRDIQITDGSITEVYSNNGQGYATNQAIADDINTNRASNLVSVAVKIGSETANLVDAITQTFLAGGNDGEASLVASDISNALDNVLYNEEFDILVAPGSDALQASDSLHATIVGKLVTRASTEDRYSVFFTGVTLDESLTTIKARTSSGFRLTLASPSISYTNRISGVAGYLNGTYLACAYAGVNARGLPHISATHKTVNVESVIVNSTSGKEFWNRGEQEQLLETGTVPVTKIGRSIQASRAVTKNPNVTDVFYEQNIVFIVDYIKNQVNAKLNPFIGRPNIERIRNMIGRETDGVLEQDKLDEIIQLYLPTVVREGNDPTTVLVEMAIKPSFSINFINVSLTISRLTAV